MPRAGCGGSPDGGRCARHGPGAARSPGLVRPVARPRARGRPGRARRPPPRTAPGRSPGPVGRRAGGHLAGRDRRAAAAVLHHDGLAERPRQRLHDDAADDGLLAGMRAATDELVGPAPRQAAAEAAADRSPSVIGARFAAEIANWLAEEGVS